jgi:hypothetical protein
MDAQSRLQAGAPNGGQFRHPPNAIRLRQGYGGHEAWGRCLTVRHFAGNPDVTPEGDTEFAGAVNSASARSRRLLQTAHGNTP